MSRQRANIKPGDESGHSGPFLPPPRRALSRRKRRLFALCAALLPLIGLACLEGALRLAGIGGYAPVFTAFAPVRDGTLILTERGGAARFFYANRDRPGAMAENAFVTPKPAGTLRVFLCGESAIKGFPQTPAFAASAFLNAMLRDLAPDRRIEIINLGATAVASFPMLEILDDALAYEPDVVVIYGGHNEFYGAYGVASLSRATASPLAIRVQYALRRLGLVQGIARLFDRSPEAPATTLMEAMVGQSSIGPDDSLRDRAAANLHAHVAEMVRRARKRGADVIVCTLPCNERDLAPLGTADLASVPESQREAVMAAVETGLVAADHDPAAAVESIDRAVQQAPKMAQAHFALGRARFAMGDYASAPKSFQAAVDFDAMPWRGTSRTNDALHSAASEQGALLCDVQAAFRSASPGGCIGWELMDDHVHPSLAGQALLARTIAEAIVRLPRSLGARSEAIAKMPDGAEFARRLGDNLYDRYAAAYTIRTLATAQFYRETNPGALRRFDLLCRQYESAMPPPALEAVHRWQQPDSRVEGVAPPISGVVGSALLRQGQFEEAARLLDVARRSVGVYSAAHLNLTADWLAARRAIRGQLDANDAQVANDALASGRLLLEHRRGRPELVRCAMGELCGLLGRPGDAVAYLLAARAALTGMELVRADTALVAVYVETGRVAAARDLLKSDVAAGGEFARYYHELLGKLPAESGRPAQP